ncbi:MAG: DegV family protein [Eubacteriales bacterium]|nr:DegV family protein [Eubacteriales bacterium]
MYVLFTDTDCDITVEGARKLNYNVISMPYTIDDKDVYPNEDYEVFDGKAYYDILRSGKLPSTSAISEAKYMSYFEPFFQEGKDILYVHFSSAMSMTFQNLEKAIAALKEKYPERNFYRIDTKGISILSLNILYEVSDMYKEGKSAEEIIKWAETEVDKFAVYFFADDLKFFKKSGRVNGITATMGNLIGIRPIIYVDICQRTWR